MRAVFAMRRLFAVTSSCVASVMLSGCPGLQLDAGGDDADGGTSSSGKQSASCSPLDGIYRFDYQKRSGNCDTLPEELLQFTQGRLATAGTHNCQAGGDAMISSCDLQLDRTCAVSDALSGAFLGMTHIVGTLSEPTDNTSIEGTLDFTLVDTTGATCTSTFEVTGTRVR